MGWNPLQFHVVLCLLVLSSLHTFRADWVYRGLLVPTEARETYFVWEIEKDVIHALLFFQHLKVTVQRAVWINSAQIKKKKKNTQHNKVTTTLFLYWYTAERNSECTEKILTFLAWRATRIGCRWRAPLNRYLQDDSKTWAVALHSLLHTHTHLIKDLPDL